MSPAEKRYFKRHYGSSANVLTDLFDAINAQEKYDEASIKELFPPKVAINLKVYKFQLEQQVLQSLISSGYFTTVGSKIRLGLEQADILAERNLVNMAIKQLEKTKQLCLKYEEFPYLLEIIAKEFRLKYVQVRKSITIPEPSFDEHRTYLTILEELNKLTDLAKEVGAIAEKWPAVCKNHLKKARAYLDHPLLNKTYPDAPIRSGFVKSQIYGNIRLIEGDIKSARKHFEEGVNLFAGNKALSQHFSTYYLLALRRCISLAIHLREIPCAEKRLKEINQFLRKKKQHQPYQLFTIKSELQMTILTAGKYMEQQKLERKLSQLIRNYNLPNKTDIAELYMLLAMICVVKHQFNEAMDYLQITATQDREIWHYFQDIASVIELLIYYEQHEQQHARRKLAELHQQQGNSSPQQSSTLLKSILQLFTTLLTQPEDAKNLAANLLLKLNEQPDDRLTLQCHTICFPAWLQSVAAGRPYHTVLAEAR